MTPRGRRIFMFGLLAWLIVSPVGWALWQWQSEREARSSAGLATTLSASSTCSAWELASSHDRTGYSRRAALARGWSASHAAPQVSEHLDGWCKPQPLAEIGGFSTVPVILTAESPVPGQ